MSVEATRAVWKHSKAKGGARLIMLALADEANDEGFVTAYRRSQSHLAAKTLLDEGTVRRALAFCRELGELELLARGNGRQSSDYRLVLPDLEGVQNAPPGRASRAPSPSVVHPQGARDARPINPLFPSEPASPPQERADVEFDRFWTAYPRKRSKGQASKAWASAVRKVAGSVIADAAERFAADPNLPDEAFVPYPATWLNGERWADPDLAPRPEAHVDPFSDPPPRPGPRTCATGQCDGSGWLDEEFDPFNAGGSPSVARPCPSCRPPSTQATA